VVDKGWVEAEDLQVGMRLLTKDGNVVDIDGVERREGEFTVYNFAVEGIPTYFVSDLGLLVHNACGGSGQVRVEDVTTGPHGPDRSIEDVVSRARQINPRTGRPNGPQGRWLSREAGEQSVADANLDTNQMMPGEAYSIPLEPGSGVVVRPFNEYPETGIPSGQRYILDPADRAVVIRKSDGIHSFPIGPEHPAYNRLAPTL
jgi:hypothetical protein